MITNDQNISQLLHTSHPITCDVDTQPANQLEPYTWKEIRLFLSSSFIDTHAERDALIKRVIPNVNRKLAGKFIYIVPVDLRWGVLKDESKDCYAIQRTCLNQIDNCRQNVQQYPWFLGLRTQRYGWVQDKLLPGSDYSNPQLYAWVKTIEEHNKELSITSLECIHSTCPSSTTKTTPHPTIFFYKRIITNPNMIERHLRWVFDFEYAPEDADIPGEVMFQYTKTKNAETYRCDRDGIDEYLRSLPHVKYSTYECVYEEGGAYITGDNGKKKFGVGHVTALQEFETCVEKDLLEAVEKNFVEADTSGLPAHILKNIPHENAVREKAATFVGRGKLYEEIYRHCEQRKNNNNAALEQGVLVIHGNPGCGKSALLATVSSKCLLDLRSRGDFVFAHAVDSCPGSSSLEELLRRMQINLRKFRIQAGETGVSEKCDQSITDLKNEHVHFMEESARNHPDKLFVILIDAVNQLHESLNAWAMWWLPTEICPSNLRFVISTLNEENNTFENACKVSPGSVKVAVEEMSNSDGEEMVATLLARFNKKLTVDDEDTRLGNQMQMLLEKNLSPLYLTAATQALRRFGVYENVTDYIKSLPPTIPDLFNFLLDGWAEEYGTRFVRDVVCILCICKDGLLENEFNDLIAYLEEVKGFDYQCSFSRLYDSLCGFLAAGGGGYLRFFHDQLNKVVRKKFLTPQLEVEVNMWLYEFFLLNIEPQLCEQPSVEPPSYYPHCLEQVVDHMMQIIEVRKRCPTVDMQQQHQHGNVFMTSYTYGRTADGDFVTTLRNIYFIRERVAHNQVNTLQKEYIDAVGLCTNEIDKSALIQWSKFTQLYAPHIISFPHCSYNMSINQTPTSHVAMDTRSLPRPTPCKGFPFYWSNIPLSEDSVVLRYTSERCGACTASSRVDNKVVLGSSDDHRKNNKVFLYEADSGVVLHQVETSSYVRCVYLSCSSHTFWAGDKKGYVNVWSVETGGKVWKSEVIDDVIWLQGMGSGKVGCGTTNGMVKIFNEQHFHTMAEWSTQSQSFCYCCHQETVLSGHKGVIKHWSVQGELARSATYVKGEVHCVKSHPVYINIIGIVLKYEDNLGFWEYCVQQINITDDTIVSNIPDTSRYCDFTYSSNGTRILAVNSSDFKTIMVYDSETGRLVNTLKGHSSNVYQLSTQDASHDESGCELVTASGDGSMLFKLPTIPDENVGAGEVIKCAAFIPHSSSSDNTPSGCEPPEYVTLSMSGNLVVWSSVTFAKKRSVAVQGWEEWAGGLAVHPSGSCIGVYTRRDLSWYDSATLTRTSSVNVLEEDVNDNIRHVNVSHDGKMCVIGVWKEGLVLVYLMDTMKVHKTHSVGGHLWSFDIHTNNTRLTFASEQGLHVWDYTDTEGDQPITVLREAPTTYAKFLYNPDRVLYGDVEHALHVMDVGGLNLFTIDCALYSPWAMTFTNNGTQVLAGSHDKSIRLIDTRTGHLLFTFVNHRSQGFTCFLSFESLNTVHAFNTNGMVYTLTQDSTTTTSETSVCCTLI